MHRNPHDQPHDEIKQCYQQACYSITFYKLRCTVERAKKSCFLLFALPPFARLSMINCPCGHIAIDCQLLAWHPVQCKTRTDLSHSCRALCYDHEIDDQKNAKNHQPEKNAAAHNETGKPFDNVPGSIGSCVALSDDQLCRRHV